MTSSALASPVPASPVPASPSLASRLEAAAKLGWTATCLDPDAGWLWRVRKGERSRVLVGQTSALNDAGAARLAHDKFYAGVVLEDAGFSIPATARCLRPDAHQRPDSPDLYAAQRGLAPARALAERIGDALVVKPNAGAAGREVSLVETPEQLAAAVERIWAFDPIALVQQPIAGLDLRIDMLDGELLLAYLRRPLRLRGDGRSTLLELLRALDPRAASPERRAKLARDPLWRTSLAANAIDESTVLARDRLVEFPAMILNLNRCCSAEVFDRLPAAWIALARRVAEVMNLRHLGIDLRIPASADPLAGDPAQAVILEVNSSPSLGQIRQIGAAELVEAAELALMRAMLEG